MQLKYAVLLGSVRRDRMGIRAARLLLDALAFRGHAATLVDPIELKLPLLDRMYKEYPKGEAPETWKAWRRSTARWMAFSSSAPSTTMASPRR